ncbi:GrpB family protein [Micromonospora sp. LOL_021]|uniref:GrpB family protein n=1 Tax=Micromonospora sp. LOL_021 TaxID=3345417 RepID=UPI003A85A795
MGTASDEDAYLPTLESLGYVLTVREPSFHEHRCRKLTDPWVVNLHVLGQNCPEVIRHRMFRELAACAPRRPRATRTRNGRRCPEAAT